MSDINDLAAQRQAQWARRIDMSTRPSLINQALGSHATGPVTAVSLVGMFTARRTQLALDIHHPGGQYAGPRGQMDRHQAPTDITALVMSLRKSCYHKEMGTWFQIQAWFEKGSPLQILVDDMNEPVWTDTPMSDLEWQAEWFAHRRSDQHLPPWWHAKLFAPETPQ